MALLIALINIIGWGLIPLTVKGTPAHQITGMGIGASVTAFIIYLFTRPSIDVTVWIIAIVAGALWTIGQLGQFISYTRIGVSGTIPLSTGFQLVGNSLIGVLIFGEWPTAIAKIIGFWAYSSFPKFISSHINSKVTGLDYIFPEMLGVLVGTVIYIILSHNTKVYSEKVTWRNCLAGLEFGIGTLFYLFSVRDNGVTNAFIYSQLCSVLSTFGGIIFLHETQSKKEMFYIVIGLVFIVGGSVLTGFAK